jgi:hypothetical protein
MKVRHGFVSNSSSSSFICDLCGTVESGYDASLSDVEMCECENGHTLCNSHIENSTVNAESFIKRLIDSGNAVNDFLELTREEQIDDIKSQEKQYLCESHLDGDSNTIPAEYCPICSMQHITEQDMLLYLLKSTKQSSKDVKTTIQSSFENFNVFCDFLNAKS